MAVDGVDVDDENDEDVDVALVVKYGRVVITLAAPNVKIFVEFEQQSEV